MISDKSCIFMSDQCAKFYSRDLKFTSMFLCTIKIIFHHITLFIKGALWSVGQPTKFVSQPNKTHKSARLGELVCWWCYSNGNLISATSLAAAKYLSKSCNAAATNCQLTFIRLMGLMSIVLLHMCRQLSLMRAAEPWIAIQSQILAAVITQQCASNIYMNMCDHTQHLTGEQAHIISWIWVYPSLGVLR